VGRSDHTANSFRITSPTAPSHPTEFQRSVSNSNFLLQGTFVCFFNSGMWLRTQGSISRTFFHGNFFMQKWNFTKKSFQGKATEIFFSRRKFSKKMWPLNYNLYVTTYTYFRAFDVPRSLISVNSHFRTNFTRKRFPHEKMAKFKSISLNNSVENFPKSYFLRKNCTRNQPLAWNFLPRCKKLKSNFWSFIPICM
jgi:hypothetical protein